MFKNMKNEKQFDFTTGKSTIGRPATEPYGTQAIDCPFCGGDNISAIGYALCKNCGAMGPTRNPYDRTIVAETTEDAVEFWNNRKKEESLTEEISNLKEQLSGIHDRLENLKNLLQEKSGNGIRGSDLMSALNRLSKTPEPEDIEELKYLLKELRNNTNEEFSSVFEEADSIQLDCTT